MKLLKFFLVMMMVVFLVGCNGEMDQNDVGEPANDEQQVDNNIEPNGEEDDE